MLNQFLDAKKQLLQLESKKAEIQKSLEEKFQSALQDYATEVSETIRDAGWKLEDFIRLLNPPKQKVAKYYEHPDHPGEKITLTGKRPAWLLESLSGILKESDCKRWIVENCRKVE